MSTAQSPAGVPPPGGPEPWYLAATPLETRPWLARMRWTTALIELGLAALVWLVPRLDLPLDHIVWLLVADAAFNALLSWRSSHGETSRLLSGAGLIVQLVLLTALLELTGGPSNPFVVVYALQVALAALALGRAYAAATVAAAAISYGVLIYRHIHELVPTHHRLNDFPTHLFTIWLAGTVVADLFAYFAGRASSALLERERALETMRDRAARSERVLSLTTLAAGAAHELATPLATIALTARELERSLEAAPAAAAWTDDARLIRQEVDRCRAILDQMSGRAGGSAADEFEFVDLRALVDDVASRLPADHGSRLMTELPDTMPPLWAPRSGLRQTVLSLVVNAFDASAGVAAPVRLSVSATGQVCQLTVRDHGPGLPREAMRRAGEPFYTTKEAGRGLGLGLFLARIFAERLGGSLRLESDQGTTAILELPLTAGDSGSR